MAIKDWKKTHKHVWMKNGKYLFINVSIINQSEKTERLIYHVFLAKKYDSQYMWGGNTRSDILKSFKNLSQALKYAKSYMRRH